jgi:3'(2'), 5'-bisphosphate nucleotidase
MTDLQNLARSLFPAVYAAGAVEMKFRKGIKSMTKSDGSPVTAADRAAELLIAEALETHAAGIPVIGEEAVSEGRIPDVSDGRFFLVDPLDGTQEYIRGGDNFTVNIAFMENFQPVMGIIYAPANDALYWGAGDAAWRGKGDAAVKISTRSIPAEGLTVAISHRYDAPKVLQQYLEGTPVAQTIPRSSSIKFCLIADGTADLYPRLGPTCEWDTAAGQAILQAAGGSVTQLDGAPLQYGRADRNFINPSFLARGVRA